MPYLIHVPSRSLRSTYNQDLPHSSSNILALRRSLIESMNSIWQRCYSAMPYSIHVPSRPLSSTYNRDLHHSSLNILAL
ncbi:hypothetical protein GIB67_017919 [Kingdonia uniflora]|uniref:Uncharacterized protein n=1 Tax=Kingdonia uniflora TaxID=39325 RepID=A0A7J7NE57_9MAGN|nr:hypothetical protein GIB67_017919 [Kingdonia uniflora]